MGTWAVSMALGRADRHLHKHMMKCEHSRERCVQCFDLTAVREGFLKEVTEAILRDGGERAEHAG